jgi:ubiquinone/menaquinone biosynthesis C-methylase UbiE
MAYETAAAKRQFDSWSWHYDWNLLQLLLFKPAHKMLLECLQPGDGRILDVGCGTGIFARRVLASRPDAHLWCMDLSEGMLRQCRKRCPPGNGRLELVQGDSQQLPFADNAFDVVTCAHSFHHYPRQEQVLEEMFRVLRPDGRLLIIDGDPGNCWGKIIYDGIVVLMEGPVRHLTDRAIRDLYCGAGFRDIIQQRRGGPLPFLLTIGSAHKKGGAAWKHKAA